ncbi:DNA polymerase III subunit chi [Cognatishimia sp. SS12]|uniref:DNA polymerase III subunit chi n=1 Tax=Cognatishimia sp. SS12 TaxID=2979465 RepID=UPI00232B352A|nr:DNA polymerase III subunit chi [Cognatishimia sp. SS12]MDC0737302.1 DNA polymerase III subunit chi [Cognatishimia sp. SS12]
MGAAYFYHLKQSSLDSALLLLLGKAQGAGWQIEVRGTDPGQMEWLDEKLWHGAADSFLPHAMAGGAHDGVQPILLTTNSAADPPRACLMSVQGADVGAAEVNAAERVCILFDGHDADAEQRARVQWKALTDAGCSAQYWSDEDGSWVKKAEHPKS